MNVRMFRQILLDFKCTNSISIKYSRSIHYVSNTSFLNVNKNLFCNNKVLVDYFSNERNFSNAPNAFLHQQVLSKVLNGPLLHDKDTVLSTRISPNYYLTGRYISSSTMIINDIARYNSGIFQMISESKIVEWITEALRLMHYQVGLPWWASIVLTTIIARSIINFPLNIVDLKNRAKQENLQNELQEFADRIKVKVQNEAVRHQLSPAATIMLFTREFRKKQKELYLRENCHPFKTIAVILLQAPVWVGFSVAIRNMCFVLPQANTATFRDFSELSSSGFLWIQNLIDIDHFFILPLFFGLTNLALMEINQILFHINDTKFTRIYRNFARIVIVCFVPVIACLPSCLCLFWISCNFYAILQNLLLMSPKIRRLGRIPKSDKEFRRPYIELQKRLLHLFRLKRSLP
ncbi:PREDICTED: mitochondrial inner membrane protein COX18 [Eufriesea mexicana]|uniref:mitochondrial inner membrane protein COX18 n=1 Tax=Eufriesea mexicana TaxID=516756 RepID=UPI00083C7421|nr:PREDICTED: mitochondrial inner membrane protein COX18 [Eufriesea mexicana]